MIPLWEKSPGEGNGNPLQYSWPGKSHEQSSLVGYSPWGHKESDTTEQLHFHFHFSFHRGLKAKSPEIIPLGSVLTCLSIALEPSRMQCVPIPDSVPMKQKPKCSHVMFWKYSIVYKTFSVSLSYSTILTL